MLFPQVAAIKGLFSGAKGVFWMAVIVLFLFVLLSYSCNKKESPIVINNQSNVTAVELVKDVIATGGKVVADNQKETKKIETVVKDTEKRIEKKTKQLEDKPDLSPEQEETELGQIQIDEISSLYQTYYGSASSSGPPAAVS